MATQAYYSGYGSNQTGYTQPDYSYLYSAQQAAASAPVISTTAPFQQYQPTQSAVVQQYYVAPPCLSVPPMLTPATVSVVAPIGEGLSVLKLKQSKKEPLPATESNISTAVTSNDRRLFNVNQVEGNRLITSESVKNYTDEELVALARKLGIPTSSGKAYVISQINEMITKFSGQLMV